MRARALDFNMRAPAGIDPADYPLAGDADGDWFGWPAVVDDRNLIGHSSICVPGAVDGLATALAELGTISWAEALEPAIRAAEDGLRVDWYASMCIAIDASGLARFPESAALFLEGRARAPCRRGLALEAAADAAQGRADTPPGRGRAARVLRGRDRPGDGGGSCRRRVCALLRRSGRLPQPLAGADARQLPRP